MNYFIPTSVVYIALTGRNSSAKMMAIGSIGLAMLDDRNLNFGPRISDA